MSLFIQRGLGARQKSDDCFSSTLPIDSVIVLYHLYLVILKWRLCFLYSAETTGMASGISAGDEFLAEANY